MCVALSWVQLELYFFFFKQKTAYEILASDWSSDVCSSDLEYGISDEMLTYSLDKNERARVEYDSFDEALDRKSVV